MMGYRQPYIGMIKAVPWSECTVQCRSDPNVIPLEMDDVPGWKVAGLCHQCALLYATPRLQAVVQAQAPLLCYAPFKH